MANNELDNALQESTNRRKELARSKGDKLISVSDQENELEMKEKEQMDKFNNREFILDTARFTRVIENAQSINTRYLKIGNTIINEEQLKKLLELIK